LAVYIFSIGNKVPTCKQNLLSASKVLSSARKTYPNASKPLICASKKAVYAKTAF
jgi:hypothetical protein